MAETVLSKPEVMNNAKSQTQFFKDKIKTLLWTEGGGGA
jgi:hypothetical protein